MNKNLFLKYVIFAFMIFAILQLSVFLLSKKIVLRYPINLIRQKILWSTPIGVDKQNVKEYILAQKFILDSEINDAAWVSGTYPHKTIGFGYIRAYLGYYYGLPWRADVISYWIFDGKNTLQDIVVEKHYDAF